MDALCVGLYWGEGGKTERTWSFTNSDRETIRAMVEWAIRAGQSAGAFRAWVQIHPEDDISDEQVRDYWSEAGIPVENIKIHRLRSKSSQSLIGLKHKLPCGTCYVHPLGDAVTLFEYYRGQRDRITGAPPPDPA